MIVTLGESLVDIIRGEAYPGGSLLNIAASVSRLESGVTFIGKISSDSYGRLILDKLVKDLIFFEPRLCNAKEKTARALATESPSGDVKYEFDFENTASIMITEEEIKNAFDLIHDLHYLAVGSVALALEPCGTSIEKTVESLPNDVVVFVDPNVRPSIVKDMKKLCRRFENIVSKADFVRCSEDDIQALYPGIDKKDLARRLGIKNFILTSGSQGSTWFTLDGQEIHQEGMKVKVQDSVGCGDTFDGALLHCLERLDYREKRFLSSSQIAKILKFATLAATENCKKKGCDPPRLSQTEELQRLDKSL